MRLKLFHFNLFLTLSTLVASCQQTEFRNRRSYKGANQGSVGQDANPQNSSDSGSGEQVKEEPKGLSLKSRVRFKKQTLLENELINALEVPKEELCKELGQYSCINEIHHIALGGVDAYHKTIYKGIQDSAVTTPIVFERIVLSACSQRVKKDLENQGGAIIFQELSSGNLSASIDNLYKRGLKRLPKSTEVDHLKNMFEEIKNVSPQNASEQWAKAACFAVLTSVEAVFY